MSKNDNSTLVFGIIIVALLLFIAFQQAQFMAILGSLEDTIRNFKLPWSIGTPPAGSEGSDGDDGTNPPSGSGSGGLMTSTECSIYATSIGKAYWALKSTEGDCASYAGGYCSNLGMEAAYDYVSGCCVFNCQEYAQTPCQTFCSSHNLQLIQTGSWTEAQCYDSAIYVCGGLLYLNTDLVSPDGTCCCYLCN